MAQSNGDETRKELERLYRCVVYDRIDDVDRMELWIKEVGIVVEKLSAIDRKQHELDARINERNIEYQELLKEYRFTAHNSGFGRQLSANMAKNQQRIAELKAEREGL